MLTPLHSTSLVFLGQLLLIFLMSFDGTEHTNGLFQKNKFYIVYGKMFLLLIRFLVVEDCELPKSTSHVLNVPISLECLRILS